MGSPTNPNGRLLVSSSIASIGTNRYRLTVKLGVKSSLTWNGYGINCYAHVGSSKIHLGTFTIPQNSGRCTPDTYTYDFNVTANTQVYSSCICTHCDGSDGWSGQSHADTAIYTNPNSPPPTPTIKCLNYAALGKYILESTLDVELSQVTDPNGDTVRYVIYAQYKNSSGNWESAGDPNNCILFSTTDRKVSINVSSYPRGTQFRIWGRAQDDNGGIGALTGYIENIYRNQAPTTPTISCSNTDIWNGNFIVEDQIFISLSQVTDPEGISVSYKIYGQYLSPGSSTWTPIGDDNVVSNTQSVSFNINNYTRGTRFKFWGAAFDNFGASSNLSSEISNIYRNRKPNAIASISPFSGVITGDEINLEWSNPGDPDGQLLTYDVYVSKNDGAYTIINNIDTTRYSYNITNDPPYTKYRFKVIPSDSMTTGDETFSPVYRKDFPASFILPINDSTVYQSNPRIVVSKYNNSNVYLCVECGGHTYNSKSNPNLFAQNIKSISNGISMCFAAKNLAAPGGNITIYNSDGTFNSSKTSIHLSVDDISFTASLDSIVSYLNNNTIFDIISDLSSAYYTTIGNITAVNKNDLIKLSHISEIRNSITKISNNINQYDTNKLNNTWVTNDIIKIQDLQDIVNAIKNI